MSRLTSLSAMLDELSPNLPAAGPGWEDVLARAELLAAATTTSGSFPTPKRSRSRTRRPWTRTKRLLLAAAVLAVILIPLGALATVNGWWWERPLNKPVVVTQGAWAGHPWKLLAYVSAGGICWSVNFEGPGGTSNQATGLCGSIVGIRPPHGGVDLPTVDWIAGSSSNRSYPKWIAGPVVETARVVVIHFRNGMKVRVPATGPVMWKSVGWYRPVRFFATPLPATIPWLQAALSVKSIRGLDGNGHTVACYIFAYVNPSGGGPPVRACTR